MHPQFRQIPPGRSASTTATRCPSCAARIAATYPPGPEPTTTASNRSLAIASDQEAEGRLEGRLEIGQEARAHGAVHHPMVGRQGHPHTLAYRHVAVDHDRLIDDRPDREDRPLGRVDDRDKLVHGEHPEV